MTSASTSNPQEIGQLVALVNQSRLSEAEQRARALLAADPDDGMLWKILSVALVRQGGDALPALRRAAELMPLDAEAQCNLGAALHDRGEWATALSSLQRALALEPHRVEALVDAANALRSLGRASEAIPLFQRALELEPGLVEARNNLGNALLDLGKSMEAAACYQSAIQLNPDDPQLFCNMGTALRLAGLLDQAAQSFGRALLLQPGDVDAMNHLGTVLRDLGSKREAEALLRRSIELDPARADSHVNLGTVLFELRRIDEAAASYRQALALQPDHAPANLNLGYALRQQRRPVEAESACRAALAIAPNYVEALAFLGELHADHGHFSAAEASFQRAIVINPEFSPAYVSIATHRKMTDADEPWRKGAEALLAKRPPPAQEIGLHYALGKYFDDVRQYDAAFDHYRRANELTKRAGSPYDRAKLEQRVDNVIRTFDAAFMRQYQGHGSTSELPVFILGMPRSGTSLAEQILASHPAVFGAGEVIYWNSAYDAYRKAEIDGTDPATQIPAMAAAYLAQLTGLSGGALRVVDKMPANFLYAGFIHAAFPKARIIHMRRHPIDTCLSIYFQNFFNIGPYANDFEDMAHYYRQYLRITNHWRSVLPASALLEIPYEALIDEQEAWTRTMLAFTGLTWDPQCLDFHQTDRVVITASKWQVRQKISKTSAGRWRNYEKYVGPLRQLTE